MTALQQASARALDREPDLTALEFEGRWYTWREIRKVATQLDELISRIGVSRRAPLVFAPRNRPSALAAFIGLTARGQNIVMAYVYQSPGGLIQDIVAAEPFAFLADKDDFSDELVQALKERGIVGLALTQTGVEAVAGCEKATAIVIDGPEHPEIQVLTSGTTGKPKRFSFSYDLIGEHMVNANSVIDPSIAPEHQTPMFLFFPLGNISGIYSTIPVLLHGIRGVLVDRFNLPDWRGFVARYRPQWVGVPASAVRMILDADVPREELEFIQVLSPAAAAVPVETQLEFQARYGIAVLPSYGATEFGGPVAMMTLALHAQWGESKAGSSGKPYQGAKLRIVDADTGAELEPGQEGLIEVCTARIGYGWIRTSDVGLIDQDGFLFHCGRADGAIVRGGFKLLPESIERALVLHPAVAAASVVGVADARLGEVPAAAIQLKPGSPAVDPSQFEGHVREHLPATYIPVHWKVVSDLPMTPSMKVDRAAVRQLFEPSPAKPTKKEPGDEQSRDG